MTCTPNHSPSPLAEQGRIVAEIEKQLTRLDAGVAALQQARVRLQRYKAAVLKAACEGRLINRPRVLVERIRQAKGKTRQGNQMRLPGV